MSYHVNPKTLMFDDLGRLEALELERLAKRIVLGQPHDDAHEALVSWLKAADIDGSGRAASRSSFPQCALLSTTDYWRDEWEALSVDAGAPNWNPSDD